MLEAFHQICQELPFSHITSVDRTENPDGFRCCERKLVHCIEGNFEAVVCCLDADVVDILRPKIAGSAGSRFKAASKICFSGL